MTHYTYVTYKESTGEYYIGVRSCAGNPHEDPYMGSSKLLKARLHEGDWGKYVIQEYPTRQEAGKDEYELTAGHLANGKCLNLSRGGNQWYEMTAEHKRKLGLKSAGRVMKPQSKLKISLANKGRKRTPEMCKAQGDRQRGMKRSPEFAAKIGRAMKGKKLPRVKLTCPHCSRLGDSTNLKRWHFDRCLKNPSWSPAEVVAELARRKMQLGNPEVRRKISKGVSDALKRPEVKARLAATSYRQVTCPHCQKVGGNSAMCRWHFDNCKHAAPSSSTNPQIQNVRGDGAAQE